MRRMNVKEIDRFIEKLNQADVHGDIGYYKIQAIAYLNLMCEKIEYSGKKSIPLKEDEAEQ